MSTSRGDRPDVGTVAGTSFEQHGADHGHPSPSDTRTEGSWAAGLNRLAASSTMHCLTGCAIGEISGLVVGTALGLSTGWTIALAVGLAFLFGYALSILPLLKSGLSMAMALATVLAADTLSIAVMEVVDNTVMAVIPGAMGAGLLNPVFWVAMAFSLGIAFLAAFPVNRFLLRRGRGHALLHQYHHDAVGHASHSWRRSVPEFRTSTLVAVILAFMCGGFTVAVSEELTGREGGGGSSEVGHIDDHAP